MSITRNDAQGRAITRNELRPITRNAASTARPCASRLRARRRGRIRADREAAPPHGPRDLRPADGIAAPGPNQSPFPVGPAPSALRAPRPRRGRPSSSSLSGWTVGRPAGTTRSTTRMARIRDIGPRSARRARPGQWGRTHAAPPNFWRVYNEI